MHIYLKGKRVNVFRPQIMQKPASHRMWVCVINGDVDDAGDFGDFSEFGHGCESFIFLTHIWYI